MKEKKPLYSPYVYHTVRKLPTVTREERYMHLENSGFNLMNLNPRVIPFDLFTDSGNSSRSVEQWSSLYRSDEGPIGLSESGNNLLETLSEMLGYSYIVLFTQGRSAEQAFNQFTVASNQMVPGNMTFSTTQHHQEANGGKPITIACEEAYNFKSNYVFKGDVSLSKLTTLLNTANIAYVNVELCSNATGGYPISMGNLKKAYELTSLKGVSLILDSTRILENAKFIQEFEENYRDWPLNEIVKEICKYSDGCVMSLKKNFLTSIGGAVGVRDSELFIKIQDYSLVSGSEISGADMEIISQGIREAIYCEEHMNYRLYLTKRLYTALKSNGVPVIEPASAHGIWLNVEEFTMHLHTDENPHISLQNALYLEGGIRSSVGAFKMHDDSIFQLIRLTLPHRLYTESHIDFIAYAVSEVWKNKFDLKGYQVVKSGEGLVGRMLSRYRPMESKSASV